MAKWIFQWVDRVDANGDTTAASVTTGLSPVMFHNLMGASAPPFHPVNESIPLQPGSYLKFVDTDESEVDLVFLVQGNTYTDMWNKLRAYPALFSPVKQDITVPDPRGVDNVQYRGATINLTGNGKLVVSTPGTYVSGTSTLPNIRELVCRCISGFNYIPDTLYPNSVKCNLTFYANQPYWRDSIESGFGANANGRHPSWFDFFKLRIGKSKGTFQAQFSSQVPNPNPIVNTGDVECPLIWTIHGPGYNIELLNQTNGKKIVVQNQTEPLGRNETLTINTANKTVVKSGNGPNNWLDKITFDSEFWSLLQGSNNIRVSMLGANTANSDITARYHRRYFGVI